MKKVALLFIILCASALNGMEVEPTFAPELPREIKAIMTSSFGTQK